MAHSMPSQVEESMREIPIGYEQIAPISGSAAFSSHCWRELVSAVDRFCRAATLRFIRIGEQADIELASRDIASSNGRAFTVTVKDSRSTLLLNSSLRTPRRGPKGSDEIAGCRSDVSAHLGNSPIRCGRKLLLVPSCRGYSAATITPLPRSHGYPTRNVAKPSPSETQRQHVRARCPSWFDHLKGFAMPQTRRGQAA